MFLSALGERVTAALYHGAKGAKSRRILTVYRIVMPELATDKGPIDVSEWGAGDEQFLMLHATATGPHTLSGLAKRLLNEKRRICAPGFLGYGKTDFAEQADTSRVLTNQRIAAKVLQSFTGRRKVLFGHSMGGLVGLLVALDCARRGETLDALVLYEPILIEVLDPSQPEHAEVQNWDRTIVDKLADDVRNGKPERGVRRFIEAWNETEWDALPESARHHLVANADTFTRETQGISYHVLDLDEIRRLDTPVLLIRGTDSPEYAIQVSETAVRLLPNAELTVLDGCGHMGPLLHPDRVAEAIEEFLARL